MADLSFEAIKGEYATLWESLEIRPSKAADVAATARKIVSKKARYQAVEKIVGVPWYVVGLIHAMESSCNFATHLHNGDKLADGRTTHVPAGRPKAAPADGKAYTWKESACDALTMKGFHKIPDWPVERIAYELERYNGWGHRKYHQEVLTPYLWSYTNHYARGKYVEDGKWSATAVSGQSGAMAILKECAAIDADIKAELALSDVPPVAVVDEIDPAAEFPKATPAPVTTAVQSSRTIFGVLTAFGASLVGWFKDAVEQIAMFEPAKQIGSGLGLSLTTVVFGITVAGLALALFARIDDARKGHAK